MVITAVSTTGNPGETKGIRGTSSGFQSFHSKQAVRVASSRRPAINRKHGAGSGVANISWARPFPLERQRGGNLALASGKEAKGFTPSHRSAVKVI
jgi:hypothetical protein